MPAPHLATERLRLRPFAPEDRDALHALFTDADVRRFLWDDQVVDAEVVADVIAASQRTFGGEGWGFWVLHFPDSTRVAGFCGFRHEPTSDGVELIYGLAPEHWGRGLATEAAEGALDYVFERLGLEEVVAGTDVPNAASMRVLEKLGMTLRRRFRRHDLPHEQAAFVLTAEAFRARRARR